MLKGERAGLRPLETEDAIILFKWFNDQKVLQDLGAEHIYFCVSLEEEKAQVEKMLLDVRSKFFIISKLEGGAPIGIIGLVNMDRRNAGCELRIVIGEVGDWGKGYGEDAVRVMLRYAFDSLNMHRVWLRVADYNQRALRTYARCGFKDDGAMRDDHYHGGKWCSARIMSLLDSEWRSA